MSRRDRFGSKDVAGLLDGPASGRRAPSRLPVLLASALLVLAMSGASATGVLAQPKVDTLSDDPAVLYSLRNRMLAGQDPIEFAIPGSARTIQLVNGALPAIDSPTSRTIIGTCGSSRIVVSRPGQTVFQIGSVPDLELRDLTIDGNLEKVGSDAALVRLTNGSTMTDGSKVLSAGGTWELRVDPSVPFRSHIELSGGTDLTLDARLDGTSMVTLNTACLDVGSAPTQAIRSLTGDGCSRLELGQTTLSIVGDESTSFLGQITGDGALRKCGLGTLTLGGSSTYLGGTTVVAGTLAIDSCADILGPMTVLSGATLTVDGLVLAGCTTVNAGATLNGNGSLTSFDAQPGPISSSLAVVNEGTVSPGHSIGQLLVLGDYESRPSSTLFMEVAGCDPTEADLLNVFGVCIQGMVGGNAALDGTLKIASLGGLRHNQSFTVPLVFATGSITGADKLRLDLPAVLSNATIAVVPWATASDDGMALTLTAVPTYTTLALGANQRTIASILDQVANLRGTDPLIAGLDGLRTQAELCDALDQLGPEFVDLYAAIVFNLAQSFVGTFERRFSPGPSGTDLTWTEPFGGGALATAFGSMVLGSPALSPAVRSPVSRDRGAHSWLAVQGYGNFVNQDSQRDGLSLSRTGYRFRNYGLRTGYDWRLDSHASAGVAVAYGGTKGDFDRAGGRFDAHHVSVGPYVTYERDGLYADGTVFYTRHDFDTHRQVILPGWTSGDLASSQRASSVSAYAGIGKMRRKRRTTFGPTLSLQYTSCALDPFTESGPLGRLAVLGRDTHSLRSLVGGRVAHESRGEHGTVVSELRLRWAHEYADSERAITAGFDGSGAGTFTVMSAGPQRDSAYVGTGVTGHLSDSAVGFANYDAEIGRSGYAAHNVNLGARFSF